ncbi:MAG: TonB-dependent receptor [Thermodesulfobacteriota bacterium]|nr:TonB-dependent receptor [Thermodesulfobacteriota bacterium]
MKRSCYFACVVYLFLLIFYGATAMADGEESPVTRLEDITVVASPIIDGNETDRYAGQKTTVTEAQMEALNAQDLSTALRRSPGVNISRYNMVGSFGGATGGAVFIRGMGSSRPGAEIKTLVDGIPMYMSVWNHPLLDLMSIDPAFSIETYKSPQPHIFGNAFGIVNIVPKRKEEAGYTTRAEVAYGSHDTYLAKVEHGGKKNNFDYYLGGGYRSSDGHRENAEGELKDLYGRVGYTISDHWDLSYFTLCNDNYADDPGVEGGDADEREGRYETRSWLSVVTLANRFKAAEGYVKLYRNAGEGDWLDQVTNTPGVREDLFNDFLFYGLKARETFRLWPGGEVIAGFDWDVTEGEYDQTFSDGTYDRWDGHDFTILSPYTAISHQIGSREGFHAIPSAGVRYYDNSDFDAQWSPHAGLILGYKQTEMHVGYSRGVIYPGLDVVVLSEKVIPPLGLSWKDLEAETVDHFEIGLRHLFGTLAVADITWFHDDGENRYVIVPPPPPPPIYDNIEEYRIQGIEASLAVNPVKDLSLFAGLTFLDTDPSDLPYAPEWTFSAGMNYRFLEKFKLSLDCQYIDEMFVDSQARRADTENSGSVDSYLLVNGKLSYAFLSHASGAEGEIYLAVENLTDADYEYYSGYPMPGATGMVGIKFAY